jgi:hypothetical protein
MALGKGLLRARLLVIVVLAGVTASIAAAPASANQGAPLVTDVGPPIVPVAPSVKPPGFAISAGQALRVAETSPKMLAIHRTEHPLRWGLFVWARQHYEVYFFFHGELVGDVVVGRDGRLGPTYTGALMLGSYARGHYGQLFDSTWVWLGFGLMFLLPLPWLRGLSLISKADIVAVLSFGISYALFDHSHVESAVWLAYPPLLYLMVRMLMRGSGRGPRGRVQTKLPTAVLCLGLLALVAARIFVTLEPAHVIDVGDASIVGAYKILHGQSIYYQSLGHGDTYGPIAYLAYVPFKAIWTGSWSYMAPARAATIAFDLLTIAGLILVGVRLARGPEGRKLGLLLAWLWAACPFSVLGMIKSTNDGLVALFAVAIVLCLRAPIRRGIVVGLGAAAKFFPAILLPLAAVGVHGDRSQVRKVLAGFVIAAGASVAAFLPSGGLKVMWNHTIGYQLTRPDIFSPWALHPSLAPVKVAIEVGVVVLALGVAFRPRCPRTIPQVAALAAALIIAVQLPALHWFYLYIVWFLPLVLIAVLADGPRPTTPLIATEAPEPLADLEDPDVLLATG